MNTTLESAATLWIFDGAKQVQLILHEYYLETYRLSTDHKIQLDFTNREHVVVAVGKGSDFFLFIDGRLVVDGSGLLTSATASNQIYFGDVDATSGSNADAICDYVKDYNTAWLPPQFTSGSCSEAAFFSGDRTSILSSLYNGGTLKSVREYCGVGEDYVKHIREKLAKQGITSGPTTTSTTAILLTDMESFVIGESITISGNSDLENATAGQWTGLYLFVDGAQLGPLSLFNEPTISYVFSLAKKYQYFGQAGLHKAELRWSVSGGTATANGPRRALITETE